ncbi:MULTISPECIES: NIF family HAD-type phosphatase [Amphritea]|uniref:NIF family HAD-type phosphatase n=1 Tax=Amphritea TaxID=515417 RepID=UPI00339D7E98
MPLQTGYRKSLGTLSEFLEEGINDIWLIDHQPNRVDFPSHVIAIPSFTGDPKDCELYRLIDRIFIN